MIKPGTAPVIPMERSITMTNPILNWIGGIPDLLFLRMPAFMLETNPATYSEYLDQLRFYSSGRFAEPGEPFFSLPQEAPAFEVIESRPDRSGVLEVLCYPSRYQVRNPALREAFASHPANLHGYLHLWRHQPRGSRPLVLCLHGFMMHGPRRARAMFKIDALLRRGLDVGLFHQPFHWRRAERPGRQYLLGPQNLPLTIETFGQNLHDLHSSVLLLQGLGYSRIGLIGASLGGYTSALYAAHAAAVDFMFLAVPALDFFRYLRPRPGLFAFPVDETIVSETRQALDLVTPWRYAPRFDPDRICVVAHAGDRLCEARLTRAWVEQWQIKNYTEVPGGHWLHFGGNLRGRIWYAWLEKMGYLQNCLI